MTPNVSTKTTRIRAFFACPRLLALVLCLATGALVSVYLGQDTNWDLLNYHLYNPWVLLHGGVERNIAPAGLQSYFNPLLDLPYDLMVTGRLGHWPRVVAAVQGLWYGGLIFALWHIIATFARLQSRQFDMGDAAALLIGISGSAVVAQAGTTFNEVAIAMLVLSALALLLGTLSDASCLRTGATLRRLVVAGVVIGAACGLKPTAIFDVPAAALAYLLASRQRRWSFTALFLAGSALGFLATYGWWGWRLYALTGDPVFPMFNNVFHSNWTAAVAARDLHNQPVGIVQWLFYPFYWAVHASTSVTQLPMRDPRLALAFLALAAWPVMRLLRRHGSTRASAAEAAAGAAAQRFVFTFAVTAYTGWLLLFSGYRYAIPIEALSGLIVMTVLRKCAAELPFKAAARGWQVIAIALAAVLVFGTHRPDWGHTSFGSRSVTVHAPTLDNDALVLIVGKPNAYVAPFLSKAHTRFIGLNWMLGVSRGHRLWRMARRRIAHHRGPIYAVLRGRTGHGRNMLGAFSLRVDTSRCATITSNIDHPLHLCRVARMADGRGR